MISVLGCSLDTATKRLEEGGYAVRVQEARSKKGVEHGEQRVVRQKLSMDGTILLTYAIFKTEPDMPEALDAGR